MKRVLSALLTGLLALALVGCGGLLAKWENTRYGDLTYYIRSDWPVESGDNSVHYRVFDIGGKKRRGTLSVYKEEGKGSVKDAVRSDRKFEKEDDYYTQYKEIISEETKVNGLPAYERIFSKEHTSYEETNVFYERDLYVEKNGTVYKFAFLIIDRDYNEKKIDVIYDHVKNSIDKYAEITDTAQTQTAEATEALDIAFDLDDFDWVKTEYEKMTYDIPENWENHSDSEDYVRYKVLEDYQGDMVVAAQDASTEAAIFELPVENSDDFLKKHIEFKSAAAGGEVITQTAVQTSHGVGGYIYSYNVANYEEYRVEIYLGFVSLYEGDIYEIEANVDFINEGEEFLNVVTEIMGYIFDTVAFPTTNPIV
jgi:hypothetical protein